MIMKAIIWTKVEGCNAHERKKLFPYIESLIELKHEVERKGIYGFDRFADSHADDFERLAIWLVTNGYMPALCEDILSNVLNASCLDDFQYVKGLIFSEFVLSLQAGNTSVQELKLRLFSYLGIDCMTGLILNDSQAAD